MEDGRSLESPVVQYIERWAVYLPFRYDKMLSERFYAKLCR